MPLVVPEVNPHAVAGYTAKGIIANPNCSTIQMVVALNPIHKAFEIKRIVVSTYQSVSGTGKKAVDELLNQTRSMINFLEVQRSVYPHRIAFNCLPHIDKFLDNGYTKEEMKMVNETRKIMEDPSIAVTATTVRVPVFYAHSESVNVETRNPARRTTCAGCCSPRRESRWSTTRRRTCTRWPSTPPDRTSPLSVASAATNRSITGVNSLDRGRQHPQGGRHQRRSDRADPCGRVPVTVF